MRVYSLFSNLAANHVDYEGNTVLWSRRLWNCKLVGKCVLFLVHVGDSACFEFLAVTCSSSAIEMTSSFALHHTEQDQRVLIQYRSQVR